MTKTKPVHEIKLAKIRSAIWENKTESGIRYNVTISRLYRDESGWQSSDSFGFEDLLLVEKAAHLAMKWIYENGNTNGN
jgi:hypothetical protein